MLALYIHIPFCVNKCPYCGFYSTRYDPIAADGYLSALQIEIQRYAGFFQDNEFGSIYIGGGTPTTLSREQLSMLFAIIREHLRITADAEITIEANPNTVTADRLSHLRTQGVSRLSLGVQSFSDAVLAALGRLHTAGQSVTIMNEAREAGFTNIGIDLIFGVAGQTEELWRETLETAISLCPEHLSLYGLSLDEGSRLVREVAAGRVVLPGEDTVAGMYDAARNLLGNSGYRQYEISNFSLPGRECRHNINYWDRGEYLGLGPGAWSFIGNRRFANIADLREYTSRLQCGAGVIEHEEFLNRDQAASETLFLGLRKTAGIDLGRYGMLAGGHALDTLKNRVKELERADLFHIKNGILRLSPRGVLLSNEALARIIT